MNRTAEFVLGLIGGILGFIAAIIALMIGGLDAAFSDSGTSEVTGLGWLAFVFSILGVVGSIVVRSKGTAGGIMLLIAAVGGVISISMFYLVPAILIFIAGLMGVIKKDKNQGKSIENVN